MRVILLRAVEGLGAAGATVEVAPGYARNYLIPQRMAEAATADSLARQRQAQERVQVHAARDLDRARQAAQTLDGSDVVVKAKAGESGRLFGSVTGADVAAAIEQAFGLKVDRRRLGLEEPIKTLGEHVLTLRLHSEVSATLTVRVVQA